MADRHIPNDEDIDDLACGRTDPHDDHYWRTDGKWCRYLDDVYCVGIGPDASATDNGR